MFKQYLVHRTRYTPIAQPLTHTRGDQPFPLQTMAVEEHRQTALHRRHTNTTHPTYTSSATPELVCPALGPRTIHFPLNGGVCAPQAAHSLTQPLPDITGCWGARLRSETHNRDHWAGGKGRGSDMTTPVQ
eukprot:jgi/Botrbrau1/6535/Bobra.40_2s0007.1